MKNIVSFLVLPDSGNICCPVPASIELQFTSSIMASPVKTERCWNQVWVQQSYAAMNEGDKTSPLTVNIRALGDLIAVRNSNC